MNVVVPIFSEFRFSSFLELTWQIGLRSKIDTFKKATRKKPFAQVVQNQILGASPHLYGVKEIEIIEQQEILQKVEARIVLGIF